MKVILNLFWCYGKMFLQTNTSIKRENSIMLLREGNSNIKVTLLTSEAAVQSCSQEKLKICSKLIWEYPRGSVISIKLLCFATLLKSHFNMGVILQIYCIFSEQHFLWTTLNGYFCHFFTSTGLAWIAALKMKIKMELLTDMICYL